MSGSVSPSYICQDLSIFKMNINSQHRVSCANDKVNTAEKNDKSNMLKTGKNNSIFSINYNNIALILFELQIT